MKRLLAGLLSLSLGWASGCASVAPLQLPSMENGPVLEEPMARAASAAPEKTTETAAAAPGELWLPPYLPSSSSASSEPDQTVVQAKFTGDKASSGQVEVFASEKHPPTQTSQSGFAFSLPAPGDAPASGSAQDCPSCQASGCRGGDYGWSEPANGGDRFYGSAEYLLWWIRDTRVPPLVSTSAQNLNGIIGPGTTVLLGQSPLDNKERSGARFTVGWWLDDCQEFGVEMSGFFLEDRCVSFPFSSNQFPVLARPFFDVNNNRESAQVATSPARGTGSVTATLCSELWGVEVNARCNLCSGCNYRVDLLGGFRFLDLEEKLNITEDINATVGGSAFGGDHVVVSDHFATRNEFYGAQIGMIGEWESGRFFVDFRGKLGLGDTHQIIDVSGNQKITPPGGPTGTVAGGLLALNSNSGHFNRDRFSVVPEIGLNFGYKVTENLRAFVGYNFLYWSNVVRPGDQIDRKLDVNRIPFFTGPPTNQVHPVVPFKETDFSAQGVNIGVQLRF